MTCSPFGKKKYTAKCMIWELERLGLSPSSNPLTVWPWTGNMTSLNLIFICIEDKIEYLKGLERIFSFIYSSTHSLIIYLFYKYLFSPYWEVGTALGSRDTSVNATDPFLSSWSLQSRTEQCWEHGSSSINGDPKPLAECRAKEEGRSDVGNFGSKVFDSVGKESSLSLPPEPLSSNHHVWCTGERVSPLRLL